MSNKEYNLDFFEAMEALKQGKVVENDACKNFRYLVIDGSIRVRVEQSAFVVNESGFTNEELQARWQIVEPEKCWLDENYPFHGYQCYRRPAIKSFAREAIKRIENKPHYVSISSEYHRGLADAVEVLKNMIGEK